MPDIETLPLDKLPPLAVTKRDAEWEQTFKPTSLAGRYWERQDQATVAHAANQQARADAALQQKVMNDSVAQSFYFKAQELPMKVAEHDLQMREGLADLAHKQKLQPMELEAKQLSNQTLRQSQLDEVEDRKFKANLAAQELEGNRNFRAMIQASGAKRGTPQYAEAAAAAREANPNMNHAYFNDVWTSTGSKLDGDAALETYRTIKAKEKEANVSVNQGGVTIASRPTDSVKAMSTDLARLRTLRSKQNLDQDQKDYYDERIKIIETQLGGGRSFAESAISDTDSEPRDAATSPAAPTTTAAPVSDANKAARDWISANPGDPRAAAIKAKLGLK